MTTRNRSLLFAPLVLLAACMGCTQMGTESAMKKKITAEPDASFMKRVKNDPFPSAGQQAAVSVGSNSGATQTGAAQAIASDDDAKATEGAKLATSPSTATKSPRTAMSNQARSGNRTVTTSTKNN